MEKEKVYDFIFAGAGAATLQIVQKLTQSSAFAKADILILEQDPDKQNDRTWCFWEKEGRHDWAPYTQKTWKHIHFSAPNFKLHKALSPFAYNMIRSNSYYAAMHAFMQQHPHIEIKYEKVETYAETAHEVVVTSTQKSYKSRYFFNSILDWSSLTNQKRYPVLQQHFVGWFIKTTAPVFDAQTATFMDFDIPQFGNTRFMYVLPFNEREALVEYTLFSKDRLKPASYAREIRAYLTKKNIRNYEITETEIGSIPMSSYPFSSHNTKRILHIGSAGGWTKPSTGFTFKFIERKAAQLIPFLEKQTDMRLFDQKTRFWWYDLLFLDVLARHNHLGSMLFTRMFKRNRMTTILRFLDEKTTFKEEVAIMRSFPVGLFVAQVMRRLMRSFH